MERIGRWQMGHSFCWAEQRSQTARWPQGKRTMLAYKSIQICAQKWNMNVFYTVQQWDFNMPVRSISNNVLCIVPQLALMTEEKSECCDCRRSSTLCHCLQHDPAYCLIATRHEQYSFDWMAVHRSSSELMESLQQIAEHDFLYWSILDDCFLHEQ